MNRVVVTGIGVVSPVGSTREEFWSALVEGAIRHRPDHQHPHRTPQYRGLRRRSATSTRLRHFEPKRESLLDRFSQFAVVAARAAVQDAQLDITEEMR